ncbi:MAG: hypothetical protein WCG27_01670 [Pseudomonadota bacterium]
MPLLIFDLPILIGFRTFKEWITGSDLVYRSVGLRNICITIFLPIIFIGAFISPLLLNPELSLGLKVVSPNWMISSKIKKTEEKTVNLNIFSKAFQAEGVISIPEGTALIPSFFKDNVSYIPSIVFYDKNKNRFFSWRAGNSLSFPNAFNGITHGNPFLSYFYPLISELVEKKSEKINWNAKIEDETVRFLNAGLSLNFNFINTERIAANPFDFFDPILPNFLNFLKDNGIFFEGYIHFRDNVVKEIIPASNNILIQFQKFGKYNFAVLQNQDLIPPVLHFVTPFSANPPVYQLASTPKNLEWSQTFSSNFLTKWRFISDSSNAPWQKLENSLQSSPKWDAFLIVDLLAMIRTSPKMGVLLNTGPLTYYSGLVEEVLTLQQELYRLHVYNSFEGTIKYLERFSSKNESIAKFTRNLRNLQEKIMNKFVAAPPLPDPTKNIEPEKGKADTTVPTEKPVIK